MLLTDPPAASDDVNMYCAVLLPPADGYGPFGIHQRLKRNGPLAVPFGFVTLWAVRWACPLPTEYPKEPLKKIPAASARTDFDPTIIPRDAAFGWSVAANEGNARTAMKKYRNARTPRRA